MATIKLKDVSYDLQKMDTFSLKELKITILQNIDVMEEQLRRAKVDYNLTDVRADPDWFSKATIARRIYSRYVQMVDLELSRRPKEKKPIIGRLLSSWFMDCARDVMKPEGYEYLYNMAKRRAAESGDPKYKAELEAMENSLTGEKDMSYEELSISALKGKTITAIEGNLHDEIIFKTSDGYAYRMYHNQDCCEDVTIEEIDGDIMRLIGRPVLLAEVATEKDESASDSATWTFYKLATNLDSVTIRWYGESNGYYSETADFEQIKGEPK